MLENICKYIAVNDKNGDILEALKEYQTGCLSYHTLLEIVNSILTEWYEDIFVYGTPTPREIEYYKFLGIIVD